MTIQGLLEALSEAGIITSPAEVLEWLNDELNIQPDDQIIPAYPNPK